MVQYDILVIGSDGPNEQTVRMDKQATTELRDFPIY